MTGDRQRTYKRLADDRSFGTDRPTPKEGREKARSATDGGRARPQIQETADAVSPWPHNRETMFGYAEREAVRLLHRSESATCPRFA